MASQPLQEGHPQLRQGSGRQQLQQAVGADVVAAAHLAGVSPSASGLVHSAWWHQQANLTEVPQTWLVSQRISIVHAQQALHCLSSCCMTG